MYRIEAAEREKRLKERQAAKLLRKLQLAELRAKAGSRATGEHRRQVERDKEAEERKRWEGEELRRMRGEEAAQLAGGDRYIVYTSRAMRYSGPLRCLGKVYTRTPHCLWIRREGENCTLMWLVDQNIYTVVSYPS